MVVQEKSFESIGDGMTEITIPFIFEYKYDAFPDEISLFFTSEFQEKFPHVTLSLFTPDDREILLDSFSLEGKTHYRLEQNQKLSGGKEVNK